MYLFIDRCVLSNIQFVELFLRMTEYFLHDSHNSIVEFLSGINFLNYLLFHLQFIPNLLKSYKMPNFERVATVGAHPERVSFSVKSNSIFISASYFMQVPVHCQETFSMQLKIKLGLFSPHKKIY